MRPSSETLWQIHCDEPESIFPYPHSMHYARYREDPEWYPKQRRKGQRVVAEYLRVKPHVLAKLDDFARVTSTARGSWAVACGAPTRAPPTHHPSSCAS